MKKNKLICMLVSGTLILTSASIAFATEAEPAMVPNSSETVLEVTDEIVTAAAASVIKPKYTFTNPYTAKSKENGVNIRRGPGTKYTSLGHLQKGNKVTVYGVEPGNPEWYYVKSSKHGYGWVRADFLKRV